MGPRSLSWGGRSPFCRAPLDLGRAARVVFLIGGDDSDWARPPTPLLSLALFPGSLVGPPPSLLDGPVSWEPDAQLPGVDEDLGPSSSPGSPVDPTDSPPPGRSPQESARLAQLSDARARDRAVRRKALVLGGARPPAPAQLEPGASVPSVARWAPRGVVARGARCGVKLDPEDVSNFREFLSSASLDGGS